MRHLSKEVSYILLLSCLFACNLSVENPGENRVVDYCSGVQEAGPVAISSSGVNFSKTYILAKNCSKISETVSLSGAPHGKELVLSVQVYTHEGTPYGESQQITIPARKSKSNPIEIDLSRYPVPMIIVQLTAINSKTVQLGLNKSLVIYISKSDQANEGIRLQQISSGLYHTCGLRNDGSVFCWGSNEYGQLGNGSELDKSAIPVAVTGLSDVKQISAGSYHTCVTLNDGTAQCWGENSLGELGNGSRSKARGPVVVKESEFEDLKDVKQISAGHQYTCAALNDGTAKCWGGNEYGQVGNGSTGESSDPVTVTGLTDLEQISAGANFTCGLKTDGSVFCWGWNEYGQIGNGSTDDDLFLEPQAVTGLTDVKEISVGGTHACGLKTDGSIFCWGINYLGQIGPTSTTSKKVSVPQKVTGLTDVKEVSAGWYHTCAVLGDGTAKCWGLNDFGQLGNGSSGNSSDLVPQAVTALTDVNEVSLGANHTCAILNDGTAQCWGKNAHGELGVYFIEVSALPGRVYPFSD